MREVGLLGLCSALLWIMVPACGESEAPAKRSATPRLPRLEKRMALLSDDFLDRTPGSAWVPTLPVALGDEMREAVVVPRAKYLRFRGVPRHPGAHWELAVGVMPERQAEPDPIRIEIVMIEGDERRVVFERTLSPAAEPEHRGWVECSGKIPGAGEGASSVDLILQASSDSERGGALVAWSRPVVRSEGVVGPTEPGPVRWNGSVTDRMEDLREAAGRRGQSLSLPGESGTVETVGLKPGESVELKHTGAPGEHLRCRFYAIPGARSPSGEIVASVSWRAGDDIRRLGEWQLETGSLDIGELGVGVWTLTADLPAESGSLIFEIRGEVTGGLMIGLSELRIRRQSSAPRAETGAYPNVLVLLVDTLRADHLGCYGYGRDTSPTLDRLSQQGVRYERCLAPSSWTLPSVASLMTGQHPPTHGVVDAMGGLRLPSAFETLPERLARRGVSTAAFSANFLVGSSNGFDQGFERFVHLPFADAEPVNDAFLDWVDEIGSRPFFAYVHSFDPHLPYGAPEPWGRHFVPEVTESLVLSEVIERFHAVAQQAALFADRIEVREAVEGHLKVDGSRIVISTWLRDRLIDLYDGEIRYWDAQLARLLEELERRGLRETTWIIVTSDHGEAFGEHGYLAHGQTLYDELVRVPLIVVPPGGGAGRTEPQVVEMIDLAATTLQVFGLPLPEDWRAVPLPVESGDRATHTAAFSHVSARIRPDGEESIRQVELSSVSTAGWKAIDQELGAAARGLGKSGEPGAAEGTRRFEIYDLTSDTKELFDLASGKPDIEARLRSLLERWRAATPHRADRSASPDPEAVRAMRRMGYFGR